MNNNMSQNPNYNMNNNMAPNQNYNQQIQIMV